MSGPARIYAVDRRLLAVRLHPDIIGGLKEVAARHRTSITQLIEQWATSALVDEGLPAPDPRQTPDTH